MPERPLQEMSRSDVMKLSGSQQVNYFDAKFQMLEQELDESLGLAAEMAALDTRSQQFGAVDAIDVPHKLEPKLGVSSWSYKDPQFRSSQLWLNSFWAKMGLKIEAIASQMAEDKKKEELMNKEACGAVGAKGGEGQGTIR